MTQVWLKEANIRLVKRSGNVGMLQNVLVWPSLKYLDICCRHLNLILRVLNSLFNRIYSNIAFYLLIKVEPGRERVNLSLTAADEDTSLFRKLPWCLSERTSTSGCYITALSVLRLQNHGFHSELRPDWFRPAGTWWSGDSAAPCCPETLEHSDSDWSHSTPTRTSLVFKEQLGPCLDLHTIITSN